MPRESGWVVGRPWLDELLELVAVDLLVHDLPLDFQQVSRCVAWQTVVDDIERVNGHFAAVVGFALELVPACFGHFQESRPLDREVVGTHVFGRRLVGPQESHLFVELFDRFAPPL